MDRVAQGKSGKYQAKKRPHPAKETAQKIVEAFNTNER
jgi:hypothetical protein